MANIYSFSFLWKRYAPYNVILLKSHHCIKNPPNTALITYNVKILARKIVLYELQIFQYLI